jgi:hypothetical protein
MKKIIVLTVALCSAAAAQAADLNTLGVRGGGDTGIAREEYSAAELYYYRTLPWQKQLADGIVVYSRIDAGVGYLRTAPQDANWVAVGADVVVSFADGWVTLDGGFRPGWLGESRFGEDDFGGSLQFWSHAGLTVQLGRLSLGYRFQHISNADIYDENDGIDLHMVGVGVVF